ncbi:MAG: DMT family transporter [Anaerovoracaceae bacterium]
MSRQVKADLMLVIVTICWGISYFLMDIALTEMGAFTLNAYRFLGAFVIAVIFTFPKLKGVNKRTLIYSMFVGIALFFVYIGATYGVLYTSLSNAGFLCALSVIFTPFLNFVFKKEIPNKKMGIVVLMCLVGIALLTLNNQLQLAWGDLLCILCAFAYAVDLIITETAVKKDDVNAFQLGVFQLGFMGVFCLIAAFVGEKPSLPEAPRVWASVLFLSIFCTGVAFIVQAVAQQYTTANHVGVIFTLEPVFAGIVAFVFAGEVLLPRAYAGGVLLLLALLVMEMNLGKLFKPKDLNVSKRTKPEEIKADKDMDK